MVRGVPWDDLFERKWEKEAAAVEVQSDQSPQPGIEDVEPKERNLQKDAILIGKNFAQGFVIGGISGSVFGMADIMMDIKAMSAGKTNHAPAKVFRFGSTLGIFLSSYYGLKKTLYMYNPYVPTMVDKDGLNDLTAAFVSFVPLAVYSPMRRYIPYAALLLGFDYMSSNK